MAITLFIIEDILRVKTKFPREIIRIILSYYAPKSYHQPIGKPNYLLVRVDVEELLTKTGIVYQRLSYINSRDGDETYYEKYLEKEQKIYDQILEENKNYIYPSTVEYLKRNGCVGFKWDSTESMREECFRNDVNIKQIMGNAQEENFLLFEITDDNSVADILNKLLKLNMYRSYDMSLITEEDSFDNKITKVDIYKCQSRY